MFWLGLTLPICYVAGWTGVSIPTQWALLSCVLPLALWRVASPGPLHWAGILFLAYACLGVFWAPDRYNFVYGLWIVFLWAGCFWLGSTTPDLRPIIRGLGIGLGISGLVAVAQTLGFDGILTYGPLGHDGFPGLLFNKVAAGAALALVITALASERMWWLAASLLPYAWLTHSRTAYLGLAVGAIALLRRPLLLAIPLAAAGVFFIIHPGLSDIVRLQIWDIAYHALSPIGFGAGAFNDIIFAGRNHDPLVSGDMVLIHPEFAHNDYLQFAFEYGLAALVPLGILALCLTRRNRQWPVLATFACMSAFAFPAYMPITAFLGFLVAGRLAADWNLAWANRRERRLHLVPRSATA